MHPALRLITIVIALLLTSVSAAGSREEAIHGQLAALDGVVAPALHQALSSFYALRAYRAAWHDDQGPTAAASELLARLVAADREGLNPYDYLAPDADGKPDATTVPADVLLTLAYARYASHLRNGRYAASTLDVSWHIPDQNFNPFAPLGAALVTGQIPLLLDALPPRHAEYRRLRDALVHYRSAAESGGWASIPPGPALRPGMRSIRVVQLRDRLAVEGPDLATDDPQLLDPALVEAVRAFQQRNGLHDDGIAGPMTLRVLNIDVATRVAQIRTNLERWRWLPHELGSRHLLVNTAGHELQLVEDGETTLTMKTISGRADRQSPSFASRITRLVLHPPWTVPTSIAVKDLLPELIAEPGYLHDNRYDVLRWQNGSYDGIDPATIDWREYSADHFPFTLRQRPGPQTALGRIKFDMPNRFSIFLHDTPARSLFASPIRDFSSGCIRLERPLDLASNLLGNAGDGNERVVRELADPATRKLALPESIPVYLAYLTAWTDRSGATHFRPDLYNRDTGLLAVYRSGDH